MESYDVVLLAEQALTDVDAEQVRGLHADISDPVVYHVLMPMEDAAARIEASMASLTSGEMMPGAAMGLSAVDLDEVRQDCADRSKRALAKTVDALRAARPEDEPEDHVVITGTVAGGNPIDALAQMVQEVDGREAIILTRPHVVAEFFHVDWTSRARRKVGVPVLHLLEHEAPEEQAGSGEGIHGF